MNEKHLEYFKKSFSDTVFRFNIKDMVIEIENPRQPIYIDPENGDEFFEGEESFWFNKLNFKITDQQNEEDTFFRSCFFGSKSYNTLKKCELALMNFIAKKHNI